jgi:hypothetical protein
MAISAKPDGRGFGEAKQRAFESSLVVIYFVGRLNAR